MNKLVDQHNNTHRSIGKKHVDSDYSDLTEEIELSYKVPPKFKVGNAVRITKYKSSFAIKSVLKTNP